MSHTCDLESVRTALAVEALLKEVRESKEHSKAAMGDTRTHTEAETAVYKFWADKDSHKVNRIRESLVLMYSGYLTPDAKYQLQMELREPADHFSIVAACNLLACAEVRLEEVFK